VVAIPDLTLTITPPGGSPADYTEYLMYSGGNQQMTITQNFGRQGDTAVLTLYDEYKTTPHVIIPVMSQVKLIDNIAGQTLFAGVVNDPVLCPLGTNANEWDLNCTDFTFYADNSIIHAIRNGQSLDQIVVELTQEANCGITAAAVAAGGYVAPGPVLPSYVLNYNTLSSAWRSLATLGSQVTPYGWYVDENRQLHFYDQSTALATDVTFTTNPTTSGSTAQGHILLDSQFAYEWDGTSIRNRVLVQGATQTITAGSYTTSPPTDTWQANGADTSWPLRYTVTGSPTLTVNGVSVSVTVVSGSGTASGTWVVEQNTTGSWFLTAATPPAAGTILKIWYDYSIPVVAQANDLASQAAYTGPNGGIFEEYISDSSLTTTPMALARAMQDRQEYAFAAERITFDTSEDWLGWVRAGWTCTIDCALIPDSQRGWALGVNDTFIVTQNRVTFGESSSPYRQCQITAVRL
jgi:hypothetical protein